MQTDHAVVKCFFTVCWPCGQNGSGAEDADAKGTEKTGGGWNTVCFHVYGTVALAFGKKKIDDTSSSVEITGSLKVGNVTAVKGVSVAKGITDDQEEGDRSRFYMLGEIDANSGKYHKTGYDDGITLKSFCDEFRNFASNKLKLFYSIDDIRRFSSK